MKNNSLIAKAVLSILFMSFAFVLWGQVTIGSGISPNKGALLDLKDREKDKDNITASKGLNLPRVKLTDSSNLFPMFTSDNSGGYKEGVKANEDKTHVGLMVYHIDNCSLEGIGLYLWNGSRWKKVNEQESAAVYPVVDSRDGEVYLARNFGSEAGDWMLENMRYTDPSITLSKSSDKNLPVPVQNRIKRYFYPNGSGENPPATWSKVQGLLYTYSAATMGAQDNITVDQGQNPGKIPSGNEVEVTTGQIQGICPQGWHIPTDREWNDLEREIYNNPEKYSTYLSHMEFNPTYWNSQWESGKLPIAMAWRGSTNVNGHGYAMQSSCPISGGLGVTNGRSLAAYLGGFDALPTGYAEAGSVLDYGEFTYFWTASSAKQENSGDKIWSWDRIMNINDKNIKRLEFTRNAMFCIRCKKNE